jgi:hypothetical protein
VNPLTDVIEHGALAGLLGAASYAILNESFFAALESSVDAIATAITPFFE